MSGALKNFHVESLHGMWTIDMSIEDNTLVLVGENGTGKTTVANFIYFFLTGQWHRLSEYNFKALSATIDSENITLKHEDIENFREVFYNGINGFLEGRMPFSLRRQIQQQLVGLSYSDIQHLRKAPDEIEQLAIKLRIPPRSIRDYISLFPMENDLFSYKLVQYERAIKSLIDAQILYLPTYRRIEQDLQSIFPNIDDDEIRRIKVNRRKKENSNYIELVEFGMDDVEKTIVEKMQMIKDKVMTNWTTNMPGRYLHDVIQGVYKSANVYFELSHLDDSTINSIFSRIPETILTEQEQYQLQAMIQKIKTSGKIEDEDKIVAHFLTQLIELHKQQQTDEKAVQEFITVCNWYLSGKEPTKYLVYDNIDFNITITQKVGDSEEKPIEMKDLSSGEKQIISLFSHIYLSGRDRYFVIIDEPELSLSVPWQKKFLTDILDSERCHGLIAVTHSPFVYDNKLKNYTHSLEEFMEVRHVLS